MESIIINDQVFLGISTELVWILRRQSFIKRIFVILRWLLLELGDGKEWITVVRDGIILIYISRLRGNNFSFLTCKQKSNLLTLIGFDLFIINKQSVFLRLARILGICILKRRTQITNIKGVDYQSIIRVQRYQLALWVKC
jgi:hypothetical protein